MTHRLYDTIGGNLWVDADENEMERLKAESQYEWRKVEYIRRNLKLGMSFVDVGAHVGYFTMLAARLVGPAGRVVAFEPDADNIAWLMKSAEINNYTHVAAIRAAIGAKSQTKRDFYRGKSSGQHSVLPIGEDCRQVYQTTLNAAVGRPVEMLKIDVEGAEYDVLAGANMTLSMRTKILIDLHPDLGVDPLPVERFLISRGFGLYDIRSGFLPLKTIPRDLVELLAVRR